MQLGHLAIALSIATYDWSVFNAAFCLGMHYLPNVDSVIAKADLDKPIIVQANRIEAWLRRKKWCCGAFAETDDESFWSSKGGFHCTVTHSLAFAVITALLIAPFSMHYAILAFLCLVTHYLADIGSTIGLPLLWPFSRRRFTLALFKDTGWWGMAMIVGYYKQPVAVVLECGVMLFLVYRMLQIF
ncbi:MAG: metal-dependent hydrolase [Calditrichaeota bacterium]|nr:MAG: metal-dependent hydrolase [Calditrichota bacterium]